MSKELSPQQKLFLEALGGEAKGNIRNAMNIAGYSKNYTVRELTLYLREEMIEVATNLLASNATAAVFGLINTLDDPTTVGAKNVVIAAKEILDRAGIVKKEQLEIKTDGGGVVLLPPKRRDDDE